MPERNPTLLLRRPDAEVRACWCSAATVARCSLSRTARSIRVRSLTLRPPTSVSSRPTRAHVLLVSDWSTMRPERRFVVVGSSRAVSIGWRLVDHEPEQSKLLDGLGEVVELDRLDDVGVDSFDVASVAIALFV
jgi:hypothetical protein